MVFVLSIMEFHGFGLVQDAMALLMLALSLALVAPRYADALLRQRAQAAAERIVTDLATAQLRARKFGGAKVSFSPTTNSYQVICAGSAGGTEDAYAVSLSDPPLCATFFGADLGEGLTICFDSRGVPDHGGSITVGAGESMRTITIDAASGATTIA